MQTKRSYSEPNGNPGSLLPFGLSGLDPLFLQNYRIIQALGKGGHGYVVSAIHRQSGVCVAVKLIVKANLRPNNLVKDPSKGDLIPLEIALLRSLEHPNIIGYLEHFQDHMFYYLVVELHGTPWTMTRIPAIPKRNYDLFECLERYNHLSEPIARHVFVQVVNAVTYLSQQGIYHCDIKDENILIDDHFDIKLVDFGSACRIHRHELLSQFNGTIAFASPEILMGYEYHPEPAEIWSLGILLHIILSGEPPFHTAKECIFASYVPLGTMSPLVVDLMAGMLHKYPNQRISIKELQNHPWISSTI
ncbi:kinase-like domain-containing protein [Phycomyces nitens]|nr:kinase-like domain-containing protein [Phycomyces nitens]